MDGKKENKQVKISDGDKKQVVHSEVELQDAKVNGIVKKKSFKGGKEYKATRI